jgi:selenocysteine-specific elongation factor
VKHLVAGTAGHIDHGKTVLIEALTGIDTDRLPEEKRRGISIELGFAWLDLPDGTRVGFVDAPGHERFVRTMVAGAAGIDFALLVVAADDSVMPQTREHLAVLRLLGLQHGLVAVTKCDLVDEELAEVVVEEVRQAVAGTFLADAPIVPCSGRTGAGLEELRNAIARVADKVPERAAGALARVPIDRSFAIAGAGTVVTGTVFQGILREGEEVDILPRGDTARLRGLQSHGQPVDQVRAGQRAALNLAGVKHDELQRGDVVCTRGAFLPTMMVDGQVELDPSVPRSLEHGASVTFHLGTAEVPGRLALLDRDELKPGERAWAQLRLVEAVAARRGDRFILRTAGGDATLGGGQVLDAHPVKHRRHRAEAAAALERLADGGLPEAISQALHNADAPLPLSELAQRLGEERAAIEDALGQRIRRIESGQTIWVYDQPLLERVREYVLPALRRQHRAKPLLATGLTTAELTAKIGLSRPLPDDVVSAMLEELAGTGEVRQVEGTWTLPDHRVELGDHQQTIRDAVLEACRQNLFDPPTVAKLAEQLPHAEDEIAAVHESLVASGELIRGDGFGFHPDAIEQAWERCERYLQEHGQVTVSEFRDLLGTSRRYALPLLQRFDADGRLVREGDYRRLA